jgi:hypothetical protein
MVVEDRFPDPEKAMIVDHVAAPQGVGQIKGLVEIDHQVDSVADRIPHRLYGREVVAWIGAASRSFRARNPPPLSSSSLSASAAADSGDCSHSPLLL